MQRSLLPLSSGKSTRTKDTAINLHRIHCELQAFKRNKNKYILHTNWCEIHSSDLWSFRWSEKYSQLSEFWFTLEGRNVTNSKLDWAVVFTARYARRKRKNIWSWREKAQTVKGRCRPTWQPWGRYTRGRKQVNPLAGSRYCVSRQRRSKNLLTYTRKPRKP